MSLSPLVLATAGLSGFASATIAPATEQRTGDRAIHAGTKSINLVDSISPELPKYSPNDEVEGRMRKKKKTRMFLHMLVGLKVLAAGIILPSVVALALYASWKGITISLMAFMLAGIVGLKSLFSSIGSGGGEKHHVILTKASPSVQHEHWWRKDEDIYDGAGDHHSPYRGHY